MISNGKVFEVETMVWQCLVSNLHAFIRLCILHASEGDNKILLWTIVRFYIRESATALWNHKTMHYISC